jgi:hypothetical protein
MKHAKNYCINIFDYAKLENFHKGLIKTITEINDYNKMINCNYNS